MEEIRPSKECPKCRSGLLRDLYNEKTEEFVGYQCERCNHWWEPPNPLETGLN